ncbi:hypothetical protein D9M68_833330 [compost metagenome]
MTTELLCRVPIEFSGAIVLSFIVCIRILLKLESILFGVGARTIMFEKQLISLIFYLLKSVDLYEIS